MKSLSYPMDLILCQIFKIVLNIYKKQHGEKNVSPLIRIYINKIENRITFKIKTGYYLEVLTPETMQLLGSTKSKITENKNGKNVSNLEITEGILVH